MFEHIEVVTPPDIEPVTLAELKTHARIVDPVDAGELAKQDALLNTLITASREAGEQFTRRSLITQTIDVWYSNFNTLSYLELPRGKVQSIEGLWTYDYYGVESEVDDTTYLLNDVELVLTALTLPISGYRPRRGIKVRIVSGYGDNEVDVPAAIRQGILEYAAWMYDHRGGESEAKFVAQVSGGSLPDGVRGKWKTFQLMMV